MTFRGVPVDDRPFNNLLRHLTDQDYALLAPHLERVNFPANEILYHPGEDVRTVYFPCDASSASFVISIEDGRDVQTVLVGHEGAVGGIVSHGFAPAFSRIVVACHLEHSQARESILKLLGRLATLGCLAPQLLGAWQ
jgi:hypothetical protein